MLVDNAAMQLVARPAPLRRDVTENMFGDILSDEAAMITGTIGMPPSAALATATDRRSAAARGFTSRSRHGPGHRRGEDRQPDGDFLSAALMLRNSLDMDEQALEVESAVERALDDGVRTPDLGGAASTADATRAVLYYL